MRRHKENNGDIKDVYCPYCGHFLGKENLIVGYVAFYCRYCKEFIEFSCILVEEGEEEGAS